MAWSWSHTPEAYANAEANFRALPREELLVIWKEWQATTISEESFSIPEFHEKRYARLTGAGRSAEDLADYCWPRIEEFATCTNGGWQAWVCPYGCHMVPFSRPGEADEEEVRYGNA